MKNFFELTFWGYCDFEYKKYIKINGYDSLIKSGFEFYFKKNVKGLDKNSSLNKIIESAKIILLDELSKRLKNCSYEIKCTIFYCLNGEYSDEYIFDLKSL